VRQTRLGSWLEAWANILVGFGVNFLANLAILPLFGFHVTGSQAAHIGLFFTAISLVRSYLLRRAFNRIHRLHA
jgi:polyferredoxin